MDSHGSHSPVAPGQGATHRPAGVVVPLRQQAAQPLLYSWQASDGRRGSCGITSDPNRAGELLADAMLRLAPGGTGTFRMVRLDAVAPQPSYVYGRVLARYRRSMTEVVEETGP
ncbi:hypothetical protein GCM10027203_17330 [Nonomuraea fastidiosa]